MKKVCYVGLKDLLFNGSENCTVLDAAPKETYLMGVKEDGTISVVYKKKVLTKRSCGLLPWLMTDDLDIARMKLSTVTTIS